MTVRMLGEIVRLQVQTTSLKVGQAPRRRYDPAGIVAVPELVVDTGGVSGITADGGRLSDVHHADHPITKSRGNNGVSVLFTAHYDAMRERFGGHLADGIAGETILVAHDELLGEDDVVGGFRIVTALDATIDLGRVIVADPCVEFGRYALRFPDDLRPDRTVTDAVAFLSDGMRGYYAGYDGPPATVHLGDRVYAV